MTEKRKYKRYHMPKGTFAILRSKSDKLSNFEKMSMGEIAVAVYKTGPEKLGQIKNISLGGLAFDYVYGKKINRRKYELDVLMAEQGIYLHNIPYRTVSDDEIPDDINLDAVTMRRHAIHFGKLSLNQETTLKSLLDHRLAHLSIS